MSGNPKLCGGVVVFADRHTHGLIELLTYRSRDRLEMVYYSHPYDIDLDQKHDFIIVQSPEDLDNVVRFFQTRQHVIPLIVHIDRPEVLQNLNHKAKWPGIDVIRVPQADLADDPDITLELGLMEKIIQRLEARR